MRDKEGREGNRDRRVEAYIDEREREGGKGETKEKESERERR